MAPITHNELEVKIYYEDTDALGVVYYANYLKYLERGRTELVAAQGRAVQEWNAAGFYFVVFELRIRYLKPARLGDRCRVRTAFDGGSEFRRKMKQQIVRGEELLTDAQVDLACLDREYALQEFPPELCL